MEAAHRRGGPEAEAASSRPSDVNYVTLVGSEYSYSVYFGSTVPKLG